MVISKCDAWCSMMKTHLNLAYGYVICHNLALGDRHSTGQFWYMSLPGPSTAQVSLSFLPLSHYHSATSGSDLALLILPSSAKLWCSDTFAPAFIGHVHHLRIVMDVHEEVLPVCWLLSQLTTNDQFLTGPCRSVSMSLMESFWYISVLKWSDFSWACCYLCD